jgi:anaerobic ribonucleoside-triphosphate reductase activating protein
MTPELFEQREAAARPIGEVFSNVLQMAPGHDGITISGGEPFEQAAALAELARLILSHTHLDIMVYSGYTIDEIRTAGAEREDFLTHIDILMDGRFEMRTANRKLWRGSDNQRMHLLTPRASKYARFVNAEYDGSRKLHIGAADDGSVKVIGIPERGFRSRFLREASEHGVRLTKQGSS